MLLAIDAGNTKTKWATFNMYGEIADSGACINAAFSQSSLPLETISSVIISNVAGEAHASIIQASLVKEHLPITWLKSSAECCNVLNHYTQPESLGTDRWASLIGGWVMQHRPCVVVNAGTAVTIDALITHPDNKNQAHFLGGMILPGLGLMQSSLNNATAQLDCDVSITDMNGNTLNINTLEAIKNGALHAICGAIENMLVTIAKKYHIEPLVIMSGGDAQVIVKQLCNIVTNHVLFIDNLVLKGLYCISRAQHQQSEKP